MENNYINDHSNGQFLIFELERKIKTNYFSNKEELQKEIMSLKHKGVSPKLLSPEKIEELLKLFDSFQKKEELPLDMKKYKSVSMEDQDLIISTERDKILRTQENPEKLAEEFKKNQNEMIINNHNGLVTADDVFNRMANNQKQEISFIPIIEVFNYKNIDKEILNKIRFFITNKLIQPNIESYKVDIVSGLFYNSETDEVLEVRKNQQTGKYEIYKGRELVYGINKVEEEKETEKNGDVPPLISDTEEEKMDYEPTESISKPYTRVRKPLPPNRHYNSAAFTKIGFLLINIITFALLTSMIILLNK